MPWPFSKPTTTKDQDETTLSLRTRVLSAVTSASTTTDEAVEEVKKQLPIDKTLLSSFYAPSTLITSLILTSSTLGLFVVYRRFLRRIRTAPSVPSRYILPFTRKFTHSIFGRVTSVGDADNFRVYHTPLGLIGGWGWARSVPISPKALKDNTIHVRLAGIDAPELAHFGHPEQPFAKDALAWLTGYVKGRRVRCYMHSKDQYGRVVGTCYVRRGLFRRDVGLQMLKAGWAGVYEAKKGVEFAGKSEEEAYRRAEEIAKKARKGMWSAKTVESPREYKNRTRGTGTD